MYTVLFDGDLFEITESVSQRRLCGNIAKRYQTLRLFGALELCFTVSVAYSAIT